MNTIYTQRLLQFSKHLSAIKSHKKQGQITIISLQTFLGNCRLVYEVGIPAWLTEELTNCFPQFWYFNQYRREHSLIGDIPDNVASEAGAGTTFELSELEFLHVFSVSGGYQSCQLYGGQKLTEESGPSEIAKNLADLAAYRMSQIHLN